jgi:hypothetical protein
MLDKLKQPCMQCPFRKTSLPGYVGDAEPEQFLATTMADEEMPCHLTVDYTDEHWRESLRFDDVAYCKGALIFFRNICKKSRDWRRPIAERSEEVFASPQAFLNHHLGKDKP